MRKVHAKVGTPTSSGTDSELQSPLFSKRTQVALNGKPGPHKGEEDHSGSAFMKLDMSMLVAPLEARFSAHIDAIEAMVDRRCGALEQQITKLTDVALPQGDVPRLDGAAVDQATSSTMEKLKEQMSATQASLEQHIKRQSEVMDGMKQQVQVCHDRHGTLQSNLSEVWRQVKVHRQEDQQKFQHLSDALDKRLRNLCDRVGSALDDTAGLTSKSRAGANDRLGSSQVSFVMEGDEEMDGMEVSLASKPANTASKLQRYSTAPSGPLAAIPERSRQQQPQPVRSQPGSPPPPVHRQPPPQENPQPASEPRDQQLSCVSSATSEDEGGVVDPNAPPIKRYQTAPVFGKGVAPSRSQGVLGSPSPGVGRSIQPAGQPASPGMNQRGNVAHLSMRFGGMQPSRAPSGPAVSAAAPGVQVPVQRMSSAQDLLGRVTMPHAQQPQPVRHAQSQQQANIFSNMLRPSASATLPHRR